jgi:pyruvate dehydrogenase E2 component (dihydrolipoamide acetyltransferase)
MKEMDVLMPQLGETLAEGKITKWFKSCGDAVKSGENLFEIETDKVSMEVPSIADGTLTEIRVPAGAVAPVGAVLAVIAGGGQPAQGIAAVSTYAPKGPSPAAPNTPPTITLQQHAVQASVELDPSFEVRTPARNFGPAKTASGAVVTPLARRLAHEGGVDLSRLSGSGAHGRIVAADVESLIAMGEIREPAAAIAASASTITVLYQGVEFDEVLLDGMRATIARRLVEAKQTIPHFYLTTDVSMDALLKVREEANAGAPKEGANAYKLSVNDFIIKALALALQRVPGANAVWAIDRILRFKRSDVGIAVAIDGGLLTPVIRNSDVKSISAISREMKDLAKRAKAKKLKPVEFQGGATAISNLGMYGIREFSAIINPPHATILAVGAVQRRPVEADDRTLCFENQMTVTLSCDHRVVDGALGAELLTAFKHIIERPIIAIV